MCDDFCLLIDTFGNEVAVNPQQVGCIRTTGPTTVHIELAKDHIIAVNGTVAEVAHKLANEVTTKG